MKLIIGTWILLSSEFKSEKPDAIFGTCSPNGAGDDDNSKALKAEVVRIEKDDAIGYSVDGAFPYFVTLGSPSDTPAQIASDIRNIQISTQRKPLFI